MIPNAAEPITVFDMHKMWQSSVKFHINKFVFLNVVFFSVIGSSKQLFFFHFNRMHLIRFI